MMRIDVQAVDFDGGMQVPYFVCDLAPIVHHCADRDVLVRGQGGAEIEKGVDDSETGRTRSSSH